MSKRHDEKFQGQRLGFWILLILVLVSFVVCLYLVIIKDEYLAIFIIPAILKAATHCLKK